MKTQKRIAGIYIAIVLLFTGMLSRLYVVSIGGGYAAAANAQSAYLLDVDRTRGIIYDRNLNPLVQTQKKTVAAIQPMPEAFTALTQAIMNKGERFTLDTQAKKPFLVTLESSQIYSKGVEMFEVASRYSENQLAAHIIGYLSPDKQSGAAGIELAYDELLKEYSGTLQMRYYLDAAGHNLAGTNPEIVKEQYGQKGGVVLTLDKQFQRAAEEAMQGVEKGAAVVMDVHNGDILACVSVPAYDPQNLAASLKDTNSPFVNRAFSQYNVGSVFKLVTAAAALENGFGRYTPYVCEGHVDVDGHIYNCHWRLGHGEIDFQKAMEVSCNPYFIYMGQMAGGKNIASLARDIGFTKPAQLANGLRSQSGTLPADAELEHPIPVANFSFGQGSLTATPIQIAQLLSTVANGGYAVTPRLVKGLTNDGQTVKDQTTIYAPNQVFSQRTANILQESMVSNVLNGSGTTAQPFYTTAGGKTSSAQTGVYTGEGENREEVVHAWFAGYFPADEPKYAVVVLVEGGDSGSDIAGPIFRKIADEITLAEL